MSFIYLNHLTIEAVSPLAIGTGERELGFDNQLIRDINMLPYLPATSITGVWRNLSEIKLGSSITKKWFGGLENKSKLTIGQGYLLDTHQNIIKGLVMDNRIQCDPLLTHLQQANPMHRERVSLNDRGVAIEKGKFDQILLPSGLRFRITLQWHGQTEQELDEFKQLLTLWHSNQFAFGSNTTNGLGQITIIGQSATVIPLENNPSAGMALRKALTTCPTLNDAAKLPYTPFASLGMKAIGTWRSGQGSTHLSDMGKEVDADIITYSEPKVEWLNNRAKLTQPIPKLTGASWKGIIAHRFSYHIRRLKQQWAENRADSSHEQWVTRPTETDDLFGFANQSSGDGKAGQFIFHDAEITNYTPVVRYHNTIDRFTGGVIQGALYCEELLENPEFTLQISAKAGTRLTTLQRQALQATFDDIEIGLLPIGGGSGRGHSLTEKFGPWEINWDQIINHEITEVEGVSE